MTKIGVDFDNTIICYDDIFHTVASEKSIIPPNLPLDKNSVRNYLRKRDKEDLWTELQGLVYGTRLYMANPFPGVMDFLIFCRKKSIPVDIVSHKTKHPYRGPEYNLHQAAYQWLELKGFFDQNKAGLSKEHIFFELTMDEKINRIAQLKCNYFIDDLPEFLFEPSFPENAERILFDPNRNHMEIHSLKRFPTWKKIQEYFIKFQN